MSDYDYDYDDFDDNPSDCLCSDCVGGDADVLDFDDNDDMIDYDVFYEAEMRAYEAELDAKMDALDALDPTMNKRAWRPKSITSNGIWYGYADFINRFPATGKTARVERYYLVDDRTPRKPHSRNRDRRREREQLREHLLDDELRDQRLAA